MEDHFEYIRLEKSEEQEIISNPKAQQTFSARAKFYLFSLFFELNTKRLPIASYLHIGFFLVESFQLLSYVFVSKDYFESGVWSVQTNWLVSLCWFFRVDSYFHYNYQTLWGFLGSVLGSVVTFAVGSILTLLGCSYSVPVCQWIVLLLKGVLFIPVVDSLFLAGLCSFQVDDFCLDVPLSTGAGVCFGLALVVFLGLVVLCSLLSISHQEVNYQPYPRFNLVKLGLYVAVISGYYLFATKTFGVFLGVGLFSGGALCYLHVFYVPFYNFKANTLRICAYGTFGSACLCLLLKEVMPTQTASQSASVLFYFLTPCLVYVMYWALLRNLKNIFEKSVEKLESPYKIEVKIRNLVQKSKEASQESSQVLREIDSVFNEAKRIHPSFEYFYLWHAKYKLSVSKEEVLSLVICFKGVLVARKIDCQYGLFQFRVIAEKYIKDHKSNDAYDFEIYEKAKTIALNQEKTLATTQSMFWAELESKNPRIQKVKRLAQKSFKLIGQTKRSYEKLLKLTPRNPSTLRLYSNFLMILPCYTDLAKKYLQQAQNQEEQDTKKANMVFKETLDRPLSFFDSEVIILYVSASSDSIGEILKVNNYGLEFLGYSSSEILGRNISTIIPAPFSYNHDFHIKKVYEGINFSIIDNYDLFLYFLDKNGYIFEGKILLKLVPNGSEPPFIGSLIKPTCPKYEVMLFSSNWEIKALSKKCVELFELPDTIPHNETIKRIIPNFESEKKTLFSDSGYHYNCSGELKYCSLKLFLSELAIGQVLAYVLKIKVLEFSLKRSS